MRLSAVKTTIKVTVAIVLGVLVMAECAMAYPDYAIRNEYQACSTCHASPTGGGVLTSYGRALADEMSTFTHEGASNLLLGAVKDPPDQVMVGGDLRYLSLDTAGRHTQFMMQMDGELALQASKEITVDVSVGRYGPDQVLQSRRNWLMWTPNELVHVRVGRFFPAYGIMDPNHTLATREGNGFDDGSESYNAEIAYHNRYGEIYLTAAAPDDAQLELSRDPTYKVSTQQFAYIGRAAWYAGKTLQVGASGRVLTPTPDSPQPTYTLGPYVSFSPTRPSYVQAEVDRTYQYVVGPNKDVALVKMGYEVIRGVNVETTHEYEDGYRPGLALNWFPFPHMQLYGLVKWTHNVPTGLFMFHSNW